MGQADIRRSIIRILEFGAASRKERGGQVKYGAWKTNWSVSRFRTLCRQVILFLEHRLHPVLELGHQVGGVPVADRRVRARAVVEPLDPVDALAKTLLAKEFAARHLEPLALLRVRARCAIRH